MKTFEVVLDCVKDTFLECDLLKPIDRINLNNEFQENFLKSGVQVMFSGNATKQNVREVINTWILPQYRKEKDPFSTWVCNRGVDIMKSRVDRTFKEG